MSADGSGLIASTVCAARTPTTWLNLPLAPMLTSVAEFYEEEVNLKLSAMVALIEPAILIFMGLLVAFILISLYLPIFSFSITGAAGH